MLYDTDFRYAIETHPNSSTASYGGGNCKGVFSNYRDNYFQADGSLAYIQKINFYYLTSDLPPINKKKSQNILINGINYNITSMTVESSLITMLDLENE